MRRSPRVDVRRVGWPLPPVDADHGEGGEAVGEQQTDEAVAARHVDGPLDGGRARAASACRRLAALDDRVRVAAQDRLLRLREDLAALENLLDAREAAVVPLQLGKDLWKKRPARHQLSQVPPQHEPFVRREAGDGHVRRDAGAVRTRSRREAVEKRGEGEGAGDERPLLVERERRLGPAAALKGGPVPRCRRLRRAVLLARQVLLELLFAVKRQCADGARVERSRGGWLVVSDSTLPLSSPIIGCSSASVVGVELLDASQACYCPAIASVPSTSEHAASDGGMVVTLTIRAPASWSVRGHRPRAPRRRLEGRAEE
mmetsp:Transcript_16976/g.54330  ORF Transcript_16976/g.54330 Transcript_16976/m.54330 type:complete len:316 (-) Transcript_16976:95-1042(-)